MLKRYPKSSLTRSKLPVYGNAFFLSVILCWALRAQSFWKWIHLPGYGLIGAQWGDEGKGKVVDYLAKRAQWVVRYAGGNNAGHTVINEQGSFSLHLVPSGIFRNHVSCVIGNGVVVDPDVFLSEIEALGSRGVNTQKIYLSDRAHLIMPYHVLLDKLEEKDRGDNPIGTTGKGVGPAYVDKTNRSGIRVGDLFDSSNLLSRLTTAVEHKNALLTSVYKSSPVHLDEIFQRCMIWAEKLEPFVQSTELLLHDALSRNETLILEGAQGTLLDLDHGTYPYVTSSSSSIGGSLPGLGLPPGAISGVIGVFKAYCTRVGSGPFPTEMTDNIADQLRERAWEYGTTTGRARRIGWFDGIAAKYSQSINGFTSLVLTRLDVLDGFDPIKICVGYETKGITTNRFPSSSGILETCTPVYEEMSGWSKPTAGITKVNQLPREAVAYINRLEELIGSQFHMISTGPHRDETIQIKSLIK